MSGAVRTVRLAVYDLTEGRTELPSDDGRVCFVYVRSGSAVVVDAVSQNELAVGEGAFVTGHVVVAPGSEVWLFEKAEPETPFAAAEIVAAHPATLPFDGPLIVRADRIESRSGAQTPRHFHQGPGLRRLIFGTLRAELGDAVRRIAAGEAWFETGAEPVVGTNYGADNAAFVRLLVLPAALSGGKSSFVASDATEAAKPRSVAQRLFGESA